MVRAAVVTTRGGTEAGIPIAPATHEARVAGPTRMRTGATARGVSAAGSAAPRPMASATTTTGADGAPGIVRTNADAVTATRHRRAGPVRGTARRKNGAANEAAQTIGAVRPQQGTAEVDRATGMPAPPGATPEGGVPVAAGEAPSARPTPVSVAGTAHGKGRTVRPVTGAQAAGVPTGVPGTATAVMLTARDRVPGRTGVTPAVARVRPARARTSAERLAAGARKEEILSTPRGTGMVRRAGAAGTSRVSNRGPAGHVPADRAMDDGGPAGTVGQPVPHVVKEATRAGRDAMRRTGKENLCIRAWSPGRTSRRRPPM